MKRIRMLILLTAAPCLAFSQLLTWSPDFAKDNDNITITVDASKGNQGLLNYTPTSDVYVHIGLITNLSTSPTNWRYVLFTWATTPSAAQATYIGNNKWQYTINNIRQFFNPPGGVPAGETILKIAILFRNGGGTVVQRNADGSDMYVPVYSSAIATRFTVPPFQPTYIPIPEPINKQVGDNINLTAIANRSSTMRLFLNGSQIQTASAVTSISANPVLTTSGNQTIIAEADDGSGIARDTLRFFVAPAPVIQPLPAGVRDGINYETGNTSVVLVLYAPGKNRVSVIGEFPGSNWQEQVNYVMNKTPDGNYWWLRITGLTPGTEYAFQYLVDGVLRVTDPYVEKVLDPWNDGFISPTTYPGLRPYPTGQTTGIVGIVQTNAPAYTWSAATFTRPDKRSLVVYELLLRDFLAAHDWKTLKDTLNYLKSLGVNAIEIMPFHEFEGNSSWGYNPDFFFAPDKYYGPKNSLKEFIDSCHRKGIAVIMDIVLNHATGLCPLAALYWNNATNQPAANNPWFNVTATHPFNVFNDFNHESLATRYFTSRVVEHWLQEYRLDGFRFDLSKGFTQFNSGGNVSLWSQYDPSRVAIWKRYYDTLQLKSPGSYVILEHFADNTEETELSNYGMLLWGNANFQFTAAAKGDIANSNFDHLLHTVRNWANPYLIGYMESHDEERMMFNTLNQGNSSGSYNTRDLNTALRRMEMSAAFLLGMPGPKMIWEFGELGYDYSINRCVDGTINNNCRLDPKPPRWDYLGVVQRKRLHDIYSSLLKLRAHGWYRDVFIANNVTITRNTTAAFKWLTVRSAQDSSDIVVIGNFDVVPQSASINFPVSGTWYDYLNGGTISVVSGGQNINLQPGEYRVYLNRNLVNAVLTPVTSVGPAGQELVLRAFPNPMRTGAVLEVELPETGQTEIALYNNKGQRVLQLHSGVLRRGKTTISLSATRRLAAGTYFIRALWKGRTASLKVTI